MSESNVFRSLLSFLDAAASLIPAPGRNLVKQVPLELPREVYDAVIAEVRKSRVIPATSAEPPTFAIPDISYAHPEDLPGQFRYRRCPSGDFSSEYEARIRRGAEWGIVGRAAALAGAAAIGDAG